VGSFHTLEIMYLFAGWTRYLPSAGEVALSEAMRSYWSSLAHDRNPSYSGGVHWPQTNVERVPFLELDTSIQARDDATAGRCDFWDRESAYLLSRSQGYAHGEQPSYTRDDPELE
jgi:carboxylesterase type B